MKKFIVFFLLFSVLALSGDLFSETEKKWEISIAGGLFFSDFDSVGFGAASLGYYSKFIGTEVNGAVLEGIAVIGGNLFLGIFDNQRFIPYTTGGVWTTTYGGFGLNVGGGIKIRISKLLAVRGEYRRYFVSESDWGVHTVIGGISLFF